MKHIRPWVIEDAADLALALNNKNIMDNLRDGLPYPYTTKDAREFISSMLAAPPNTHYTWAIQADGKAIGSIGIFRKDNIHYRTAEMGYYIAEDYWGQGMVTHAVKEACAYVFEETDILRIFAEPFAHNTASCKVLEKCGFVFEGVLHNNAVKNGEIIDMSMYALLRENFFTC